MSIESVVRDRFVRSFSLYDELVRELPEDALSRDLPGIRSDRIGSQLWCVVGARESYARAIASGAWSGFTCSLTALGSRKRSSALRALRASGDEVLAALSTAEASDDARSALVLALLEHEAAHHGQLIRYLYGLGLAIPAGWKARYSLADPASPAPRGR